MTNRTANILMSFPLVGAVILGVLSGGTVTTAIQNTATVVSVSAGGLLVGYGLYQRLVASGPTEEFWTTLLAAAGWLAFGYGRATRVPPHSVAGAALGFGGPVLIIVGTLLYLRVRRARTMATR